jgi:DNA-binding NarL/FixJ family response regulator
MAFERISTSMRVRHSSKEIAQRLGLSFKTVEAHRAQLMQRLNLPDLASLVRFAVRTGLVTPEA